ncbi:carboxypeptidase M32 [Parasphaerochaeta coccoides]|uniref:Metal-dependent carboxypeptidase n=1 Tax=Parasphaerochaeta coccoides (strain ATCC BAA-1237 / DSM 17374 / SPN1) TaxID=760011 RepID=F4GKP5_PARC1|nr:carboxypeptidase M32 [Parasphaerochaeta coccoides]AEC01454.1 Carboxypeptidase Taq [Parasphaerochaeta coccoides DSM 17374]
MTREEALVLLEEMDREITRISHITAILGWDLQVGGMPSAAARDRGEQIGWLETQAHAVSAGKQMEEVLTVLGASPDQPSGNPFLDDRSAALVRLRYDAWKKSHALSPDYIRRNAVAVGMAQVAWQKAREQDDWAAFKPHLELNVSLARERAALYGSGDGSPLYDALLDIYEPGMTSVRVDEIFASMESHLRSLLNRISGKPVPRQDFLHQNYPVDVQERFSRKVLADMGFDFSRGLTGLSAHPFTTTLGSHDIRITTNYKDKSVAEPLFSTIHEGGHALYEQAASNDMTSGTSLAGGASLALHESQSRLWENIIARSPAFWTHYYPVFTTLFPHETEGISRDDFVRAINVVRPSLIRTASDEVTYGLHIILRYTLEKALISGELGVDDLPSAWNDGMERLLGVRPRNAAQGVLQDIHWAGGDFGYFPTYALGNLYGAQFWYAMRRDMGAEAVDHGIERGDLSLVREWLKNNILRHGSIYTARTLVEKVTGSPLDAVWFARYLDEKYTALYDL